MTTLFAVLGFFGAIVAVLVALDLRERRRSRGRDRRRDERQRIRIRDWTVSNWIYGRRANLRITHRDAEGIAAGEE